MTYKILSGHSGIVEPHADMYMHVFNIEAEEPDASYGYEFDLCDLTSGNCSTYEYSEPFNLGCSAFNDTFTVSVNKYLVSDHQFLGNVAYGSLLCLYVRREFRALTPADLNRTISAMWVMYELEEAEGQEIYGEHFHNYARLLEYHYFNAAWKDADHIHEGNGFLPQHMKMDLIFQKSMQAIDPFITLPYWDFTM